MKIFNQSLHRQTFSFFKLIYISLFFITLTSCNNIFQAPVKGFFEYYTDSASISNTIINSDYDIDKENIKCFNDKDGLNVTFNLMNPQHYNLDFAYNFINQDVKDISADAVTFKQSADALSVEMNFSKDFIHKIDNEKIGNKDISGFITIKEKSTLRSFDGIVFSAHADNTPPDFRFAMIQRNGILNDTSSRYVVCFNIQNIKNTVHEADTKDLYIGNDHFTLKATDSGFTITPDVSNNASCSLSLTKPADLLDKLAADKNSAASQTIFETPENCTAFYYTTDIYPEENNNEHSWTLKLIDSAGLNSTVIVSNQAYQLGEPTVSINNGDTFEADEDTAFYDLTINACKTGSKRTSSGETTSKTVTEAPIIYYSITQDLSGVETLVMEGHKKSPAVLKIPAGKNYKVTAYETCTGFVDSKKMDAVSFNVMRNTVYYISAYGKDNNLTNPGSRTKPFNTFKYAITQTEQDYNDFGNTSFIFNVLDDITAADEDFGLDSLINLNHLNSRQYTIQGYNNVVHTINANNKNRVLYIGDKDEVTLKNISLTGGYITSGNGAGVYADNSNLTIAGTVIVKNNFNNTDSDNIYLGAPSGNQSVINISGDISGSYIGFTTEKTPVSSTDKVTFTSGYGYGNINKKVPGVYFKNDSNIGVTYDEITGEAVIAKGGGNVDYELKGTLKITSDKTEILTTDENHSVTFSVVDSKAAVPQPDISSGCTFTYIVKTHGDEVDSSYYTINKNVLTFKTNIISDTYTVFVSATHKNTGNYGSAEVTVKIKEPVINNDLVINGVTFEKTELKAIIDNSEVTITGSDSDGVFKSGRTVTLSKFEMGKYSVTKDLYWAVMDGTAANRPAVEERLKPVGGVCIYEMIVFCNKLSLLKGLNPCYSKNDISDWSTYSYTTASRDYNTDWENVIASCDITKNGYRLPTEAEWEFAARGGDPTALDWNYKYAGCDSDDDLIKYAWFDTSDGGDSGGVSHPVGLKLPNRLGLYDMSGNGFDLLNDIYVDVSTGSFINPMITSGGNKHVRRGGTYNNDKSYCEVRNRGNSDDSHEYHYNDETFRLCRTITN